jgi:hypothetical protein
MSAWPPRDMKNGGRLRSIETDQYLGWRITGKIEQDIL